MSLQLFGHPFSSYTWKVLIALWADGTPFKFRMLGPDHPENGDELRRRWPFGQFPCWLTLIDQWSKPLASSSMCRRTIPGPTAGFRTESSGGAFASLTACSTSA